MALPGTPQTRGEQYLNAMATGSTSGLPSAPQTREEQYLDYIAKNGGGGGGGGVLVVHNVDGTLDKTWQEIHDAMVSTGAVLVNQYGNATAFIFAGDNGLGQYHVDTAMGDEFYTESADGYPSIPAEEPMN